MKTTLLLAAIFALAFAGCDTQADRERRANAQMEFRTAIQKEQNALCRKLDAAIVDRYTQGHPEQAPTNANMAKLRAYENQELAKSSCRLGEAGTLGEHEAFAIPENERTEKGGH